MKIVQSHPTVSVPTKTHFTQIWLQIFFFNANQKQNKNGDQTLYTLTKKKQFNEIKEKKMNRKKFIFNKIDKTVKTSTTICAMKFNYKCSMRKIKY